jgi:hypothetical protein
MALLFIIGVVEMVIVTFWTKLVAETRVLASGLITLVNIFIWYYVLETIVNDISNWRLIVLYALGCALGTMLAGALSLQFGTKKQELGDTPRASLVTDAT